MPMDSAAHRRDASLRWDREPFELSSAGPSDGKRRGAASQTLRRGDPILRGGTTQFSEQDPRKLSMAVPTLTRAAHYITFRLGDELFAINVIGVREVLDMSVITRVPRAPSYMPGVVNVRGSAIPVVGA